MPVGGGIGKVLTIWQQVVSAQAEAYYNAERPAGGPTWSVIFTVQFMFPR